MYSSDDHYPDDRFYVPLGDGSQNEGDNDDEGDNNDEAVSGEVLQFSWKNKIVRDGWERPQDLLANPWNVRIHPYFQQQAVEGLLDEIGWVQRVVVNDNTGHMVDGHLRVELAMRRGEPAIPVTYVSLTQEEELKAIIFLDKTGALAGFDVEKLGEIAKELHTENEALDMLLKEMVDLSKLENLQDLEEPTPEELDLDTECTVEIRCTFKDLEEFRNTLQKWNMRPTVTVSFS